MHKNLDDHNQSSDPPDKTANEIQQLIDRVRINHPVPVDRVFQGLSGSDSDDTFANLATGSTNAGGDNLPTVHPTTFPKKIGRFEIEDVLGSGGNGIVFRARDPKLKRNVALKVPQAGALFSQESLDRFLREAEAAASLNHPDIVQVYEAEQYGPSAFIAYAFCQGQTLGEWLDKRTNPVPTRLAAQIVRRLAAATQHAHERGVVHRDLKPSNVMIDLSANDGQGCPTVRITDFGLARMDATNSNYTQTGTILGTPAYMSPEQSRGSQKEVGPASDVYSLGAILYELLTGRPPFAGESIVDVLQSVRSDPPLTPTALRKSIPRELEVITLRCLEKDVAERIPTAQFLAEELDRFLKGRSILSRPSSWLRRATQWTKRQPALASLIGLLLATILLGSFGVLWQWRRAELGWQKATRSLDEIRELEANKAELLKQAKADLYVHQIVAANGELVQQQINQAQQILKATDSKFRNWEWSYLKQLVSAESQSYRNDDRKSRSVAIHPSEPLVAVGYGPFGGKKAEGWVIFDERTGNVVRSGQCQGPIYGITFSPDGTRFATATHNPGLQPQDGHIMLWDTASGKRLWQSGTDGFFAFDVDFRPDGTRLAVACHDSQVRIFSVDTGELLNTLSGHKSNVFEVRYHPHLPQLLSISRDHTARVWDLDTNQVIHEFRCKSDQCGGDFSPDGRFVASCGYLGELHVWDITGESAELILHDMIGERDALIECDFSPDGKHLVAGSILGEVYLYDMATRQRVHSFKANETAVVEARFAPDSKHIFTTGDSEPTKKWNQTASPPLRTRRVTPADVSDIQFSVDGTMIAVSTRQKVTQTGVQDYKIRLWDAAKLRPLGELVGHTDFHRMVRFNEKGDRLLSCSDDGTARIWDIANGTQLAVMPHDDIVIAVDYGPDDSPIWTYQPNGTLRSWSHSGERLDEKRLELIGESTLANYDRHNERLVVASQSAIVQFIDLKSGATIKSLDVGVIPSAIAINHSGDSLLVCNDTMLTCLILDSRLEVVRQFRCGPAASEFLAVEFSHDGRRFVSGNYDSSVTVWDANSGRSLLKLEASSNPVSKVTFDPTGRRLAVANAGALGVWDAGRRPGD